ncbi:amino acid ABC transporter permease [Streptomyces sp. NPDC060011]|uniref:amino acid ABC transporter permease n=1 Tax=unclassified Streptomyces TaxID=2593676 RepID=UPI0013B64571|nr:MULTISPECIES: amino acid ABC transporter permease [unclassified Streptomyces]MCX4913103.1 amino acid ABC transporter permease [Streptomyces sp. NBC_00687]MCX5137450.1 amino acid ABC transporter permease [Streptomyces sp. NBC_00340]MCX5285885.1 amino acid ABC transporter permease [Streptomyces sp. NBC_00198]NEB33740.1 amino acid ABC transporter permease [Streptomyces sp. SID14446]
MADTKAPPGAAPTREPQAEDLEVVPVRNYGRWIAAALSLLALAGLVGSLAKNRNLHWNVIGDYLFAPLIFDGLTTTLWLTAAAMALGLGIGTMIAVMRLSTSPVLYGLATFFVWIFRGTPLLVQIIFWGYAAALYQYVKIGVPFTDITFFQAETNSLLTPAIAALLALGLNEAAYASEIVRAGIQSVDPGQAEAAHSLGMRPALTTRRIVLPQAMRVIIPPMGNETINMLKMTALVSVISAHDLMSNIQDVYAQNYQVIPMLVVASIWYLILVTLLSVPQAWLERRYGRGTARAGHVSPLNRMLGGAAGLLRKPNEEAGR